MSEMVPAQQKWEAALRYIRQNLAESEYQTWFSCLTFVSLQADALTIGAPNRFVIDRIEGQHARLLQQAIFSQFGPIEVLYNIVQPKAELPETKLVSAPKQAPRQPELNPQLSPLYTFDNFVKGKSNKLALAIGQAIVNEPGKPSFNPFFLYGSSGVGKTHLVNAIGLQLREVNPALRVLFVPAHLFKTQYTDSVIQNKTNDFIHFYQTIDVLIIDDIQEITTARTQQAFFHIFNHLQLIGKQIILTCDKAPAEFEGIEERMLTRYKSGMVVEMERPDIALRRAILQAKIKRDGLSFPKKVIDYIAQNVESSVRELQGIVNSIMAYSVVDSSDITLELAEKIVGRAINLEKKELTAENILNIVCKHCGIRQKDVLSKTRKQEVVQARQLSMYLSHKYTDLSYAQIGRLIGRRDHSTVLHACNTVSTRIPIDKNFRSTIEEIEGSLHV